MNGEFNITEEVRLYLRMGVYIVSQFISFIILMLLTETSLGIQEYSKLSLTNEMGSWLFY